MEREERIGYVLGQIDINGAPLLPGYAYRRTVEDVWAQALRRVLERKEDLMDAIENAIDFGA